MSSISVVLPLFNQAPFIERALKSIFSQTVPPQEIIVIDDGSTDGGADLVDDLQDSRIRLCRQQNRGVSGARNRGVALAQSDLIAFLDPDDAWEPRFLEVISILQQKFPQAGAFSAAYRIVKPDGTTENPDFPFSHDQGKEMLIENFFVAGYDYPVTSSSVAIPKSVLQEIGGFPLFEKREDADTWLRIALFYPIAWSKEVMASLYQNPDRQVIGNVRFAHEPKISRTARLAIECGIVPVTHIPDLREYAAGFQVHAAELCLTSGKKDTARKLLKYARGTRRFAGPWWKARVMAAFPGNLAWLTWKTKQLIKRMMTYWGLKVKRESSIN
jgi:glycosyltransferase involved in cell wall biosynthesis